MKEKMNCIDRISFYSIFAICILVTVFFGLESFEEPKATIDLNVPIEINSEYDDSIKKAKDITLETNNRLSIFLSKAYVILFAFLIFFMIFVYEKLEDEYLLIATLIVCLFCFLFFLSIIRCLGFRKLAKILFFVSALLDTSVLHFLFFKNTQRSCS